MWSESTYHLVNCSCLNEADPSMRREDAGDDTDKHYLWPGNPSPRMPAPPLETAELSVSLIAPSGWFGKVNAASVTVSVPTGPLACVLLVESPYFSETVVPNDLKALAS